MSSIVIRIKEYIDFKRISVSAFERNVGFSNGSFASQYKNNKSIGSDKIENILNTYPEINPIWLLTGEGNMTISNLGGIQGNNSIQNTGTMVDSYVGSGNYINVALPNKGTQKIIKPDGTIEVTTNPEVINGIVSESAVSYGTNIDNLQEQIKFLKDQVEAYKNIIEEQKDFIRLLKENK